jgi:two-component system OmpR family response regulator
MQLLLIRHNVIEGAALLRTLTAAGHCVQWVRRLRQARVLLDNEGYDALLLSPRLPDGSGLALVRLLRSRGQRLPVLMFLEPETAETDRSRCVRAGVNEVLVEPAAPQELLSRLEAFMRAAASARVVDIGAGVALDMDLRRIQRDGLDIELTAMEWAVLQQLSRQRGRIYSRREIEDSLRRQGVAAPASNSLEVIVSRLRRKLGARLLRTHRGLGYQINDCH